ncbi:MAG: class I SAM-dependent methyltransferase [Actinomycetota bacterium]|nr:class I SAM-dependent methyltransferase [Actinomycetota bacterium]
MRLFSNEPNRFARELFSGLPGRYDFLGELLSFGQNARWRRELVGHIVDAHPGTILDVATGTGGVALQMARRTGARVTGVDITEPMMWRAQRKVSGAGLAEPILFVAGRAEQLPFDDDSFDALAFTYLFRYVADPAATMREMVRVVRPGGAIATLEFHVPERRLFWLGWWLYTRLVLPVAGWITGGREWYRVGRFLGSSISEHYRAYPAEWTARMWVQAGMHDIGTRRMSLGAGLVMWAVKGDG